MAYLAEVLALLPQKVLSLQQRTFMSHSTVPSKSRLRQYREAALRIPPVAHRGQRGFGFMRKGIDCSRGAWKVGCRNRPKDTRDVRISVQFLSRYDRKLMSLDSLRTPRRSANTSNRANDIPCCSLWISSWQNTAKVGNSSRHGTNSDWQQRCELFTIRPLTFCLDSLHTSTARKTRAT